MGGADVVLAIATIAIGGGLYFLFTGDVSVSELEAGTIGCAVVVSFVVGLRHARQRPMQLAWRGGTSVAIRAACALLPDAWRVGRVLAASLLRRQRDATGLLAEQPFAAGGENAADAGRRGAVILALSLAPNGFVVCEPGGDALTLHRLAPVAPSRNTRWPT